MSARVKCLELKGELEVNLNTGSVEKLRLESELIWAQPNEEPFKCKFVVVVTLKPA
ncbi:MAG: hypothetical protein HZA50_10540 [Planctomycetes bacterium]|nr:hypothetical protein [Planctomycetota bacterium]